MRFESSMPAQPPRQSARSMKKSRKAPVPPDELRPEYDFRGGVRGKYVERYRQGTNIVLLDADVAAKFKDSQSVNAALRGLLADHPER